MADTTPSGFLSTVLAEAQLSVASSAAFQTWVGATGTPAEKLAAAKARVGIVAIDEASIERPCAVVDFAASWRRAPVGGGARNWFETTGDVALLLMGPDVAAGASEQNAGLTFLNSVGAILAEMEALTGTAGCLSFSSISREGPVTRTPLDERKSLGDWFEAIFLLGLRA